MTVAATTPLSSKGQVVIPEEIRTQLGLEAGAQFVVIGDRDVVIFKRLDPPSLKEFSAPPWSTPHRSPPPVSADPADDMFLAAARDGDAVLIVSGDRHLLDVTGWQGVEVITPRTFADRYVRGR